MKYKLVIFDMDGTILDTLSDLADSMNYALRCFGLAERTVDEVRSFVGNGIRRLVERAVPANTSPAIIDQVHENFTAYYKDHCADKTKPYDGICELLSELKRRNVLLAVVSNKADYAVQILCEQYFNDIFDASAGERAGVRKKPEPDSVNAVLEVLGIDRRDAVYIGDSDVDIQTARNAGMDCISVSWGFRDTEFLKEKGAQIIVKTPQEILEYI